MKALFAKLGLGIAQFDVDEAEVTLGNLSRFFFLQNDYEAFLELLTFSLRADTANSHDFADGCGEGLHRLELLRMAEDANRLLLEHE